jgi:hypothetical protein
VKRPSIVRQKTKIWSWAPDGSSSEMTEEYEVGVRWPSACEDVGPGAEDPAF